MSLGADAGARLMSFAEIVIGLKGAILANEGGYLFQQLAVLPEMSPMSCVDPTWICRSSN